MTLVLFEHFKNITVRLKKSVCIKVQEDRSEEPKLQRRRVLFHTCTDTHAHTHTLVPGSVLKAYSPSSLTPLLYRLSIIIKSTSCEGPSNSSLLRRFHGDRFASITWKTVPSPAATGGSVRKGAAPSPTPPHSASRGADPGSCPGDARPW